MTRRVRPRGGRAGPRLDERRFHRWLRESLPSGRFGPLPLGDDAAALSPPPGKVAILSTDALVEGWHFLPRSPPRSVGRAAAAVSLSDAAAKGASPVAILLDLLVPPTRPERWLRSVATGAEEMASRFGAHVVGGDTKGSPVPAVVSTVLAWGDPRRLAPRSGAQPGDLVVTTGRVGRGGAAWRRSLSRRGPPSVAALRALLDVHPRVGEGLRLAPIAHAMLDTSDGIAEACSLLSEASGVRVVLEEALLPWAPGLERLDAPLRRSTAFFGGDYELLAAVGPTAWAKTAPKRPGVRITVVGRVEAGRGAFLSTGRTLRPLPRAGWDPFGPVRRRGPRP